MVIRAFIDFLDDERGSYTVWSLVWFIMYVLIGGVAVDGTDAYRIKTELQAAADAAALAAVLSLGKTGQDPAQVAVSYAEAVMPPELNGTVVKPTEVYVGTWDVGTRHFTEGGANPNAVYVVARRDAENLNAVEMSFLRIAQIWGFGTWWNINANAVAATGIDECHNNGIIAGGRVDIKTHTRFQENICIIGNGGISHRSTNVQFESGVYAGVSCGPGEGNGANACIGPNDAALTHEEFSYAFNSANGGPGNYWDMTPPANANLVGEYITVLRNEIHTFDTFAAFLAQKEKDYADLPEAEKIDWEPYEYLADPSPSGGNQVGYELVNGNVLPAGAVDPVDEANPQPKYKVYDVRCGSKKSIDLPNGIYMNMAIIADCTINLHNDDYTMSNVVIASTENKGSWGIHANGNVSMGAGACGAGGVELYTDGASVHFSAGGEVNNTRILSSHDVDFTAKTDGAAGIDIEAQRDIFLSSGSMNMSTFGLCPGAPPNGAATYTYALVF